MILNSARFKGYVSTGNGLINLDLNKLVVQILKENEGL
jgi:hypothetical protein